MKFSQRIGIEPVPNIIQVRCMSDELRASLWNVLYLMVFSKLNMNFKLDPTIDQFSIVLFTKYFKKPADERIKDTKGQIAYIKNYYFNCCWSEAYDFIEFCNDYFRKNHFRIEYQTKFTQALNKVLEQELSGYRFINGTLAPITSSEEIQSIQDAINDDFSGASIHISTALEHLSRKETPDYRNSIKEAISAVESVCCAITGNKSSTLGGALKEISNRNSLHGALKDGFLKLYGYTSDGDGIRHAMLKEPNLTQADAIYFLITCSAFVNYLKQKTIE